MIKYFQPGNKDGNWLQPTWEYMHSHPLLDPATLDKIGIWEDGGEIVGVAHHEAWLGEAFFEFHPDYHQLKSEMLDYAEVHLSTVSKQGTKLLRAYVNDFDSEFEAFAMERGYQKAEKYNRPMYKYENPKHVPDIDLPEGFRLKSLADENDLRKINRVLWRGFNHPGDPPEEELAGRQKMQSTPNFRKDLTIVAEAPSGDFASFAGTWFEPTNKIAYVEPVATDPDYRRMGLGRAAVLEGLRRCGELGATVAFVGSDLDFYKAIGFTECFVSQCWEKEY